MSKTSGKPSDQKASTPACRPPRSDEAAGVLERINRVGQDLEASFNGLLDALPGLPHANKDRADFLGVNQMLMHRLSTAIRRRDPLSTAHLIPGPEPLRRVVRASAGRGAPPSFVAAAEQSIARFEHLIKQVAGDRTALDAIISSSLPDARERFETEAKQNAYRGVRQIKGVAADVSFFTVLLHPSEHDPHRDDFIAVTGFLGLRCIRPNVTLKLGVKCGVSNPNAAARRLDGELISEPHDVFLQRYCTDNPVRVKLFEKGVDTVYALDWERSVGLESAKDIVMAELRIAAPRRWRAPDDPAPYTGVADDIKVPTRMYIFDLILHETVYPDWQPAVRILETGFAGYANPNDPTRDLDELDLITRIESLGRGIDNFRAEEIPRYTELLNEACDARGWNPGEFRGYRVRIQYPLHGSQVQCRFLLPIKPAQ